MQVLIDTGNGFVDYTQYVVDGSLTIEDSINVPTVVNFNLIAANSAFVLPRRASYVKIISTQYAPNGTRGTGKLLATGFITNEPEREFLGLSGHVGYNVNRFQQHSYRINVTSDEWLINTKAVPYIPAFVNQTQGQILASLASALCPNFFNTANIASGDLVPFYQYSSDKTWSDIAKDFADASRYRYQVINKTIYFVPFGDAALGISYDDVNRAQYRNFPLQLKTVVVTVPPVNDATVLGDTEPQDNVDCYFVGDGFTGNFTLRHTMFRGYSSLLISDDWTESDFQTDYWTVQDDLGVFTLAGALNVTQNGGQQSVLGAEYIVGVNGFELGGGLEIQHGQFTFNDTNTGIVGGVYPNLAALNASGTCLAGFWLSPSGTIVLTASGAAGVIIQPLFSGALVGPQVVSQPNHVYFLETWFGVNRWDRYQRIYRNLTGTAYGGNYLTASGNVTWIIQDINIAQQIAPQGSNLPVPQTTKYTQFNANLPNFALYAPINGINLNLALNYTEVNQTPQGQLIVQSLTGASGGKLPILPQNLGPATTYLLGFDSAIATATITQAGNQSQALSFFSDSLPSVGARIRFQSWASGQAIARVSDSVAIANEAVISGDTGVRSAVMTSLKPLPRTSDECELAAAAAITDREFPQFQGTYTVEHIPFKFENLYDGRVADYPRSGRYLLVNSPTRAVSGQNFFVNTVRMQFLELREEVCSIELSYGPDQYLEKLLSKFLERPEGILTPQDQGPKITPVALQTAGANFLQTPNQARIIAFADSLSGNIVTVDLGVVPVTACEVRRVNSGWGQNDKNRLGLFTTQQFTLPRTAEDQTYYLRFINGSHISRFSKRLRVVYPLIPGTPIISNIDVSNGFSPVLTFSYPTTPGQPGGRVSDVYGLEVRGPDNKTVIWQKPVFSTADLVVTISSGAVSGLIVSGSLVSSGGLITIYAYFFNLLWDYSAPLVLTFDPDISGCCADCINPRNYGAIGDGVTDDSKPVAIAFAIAGWNAGNRTLFGSFGPPPDIHGAFTKGTVVCIPSGFTFKVYPQNLDNFPTGTGFGKAYVAQIIDSGVGLVVKGTLLLGDPGPGSKDGTPWVLLENRNAASAQLLLSDNRINIEGTGTLDANGIVAQRPSNQLQSFTGFVNCRNDIVFDKFGRPFVYAIGNLNGSTMQVVKLDARTNAMVAATPPMVIATSAQIAQDSDGYLYVPIGQGNLGQMAKIDSYSMSVVAIGGQTGCHEVLNIIIPVYCADVLSTGTSGPYLPVGCPSIGGDCCIFTGPSGVKYVAQMGALNQSYFTDVPIMRRDTMQIVRRFYYAGGGLLNFNTPMIAADKNGTVYVINIDENSKVWLTSAPVEGGADTSDCTPPGTNQFTAVPSIPKIQTTVKDITSLFTAPINSGPLLTYNLADHSLLMCAHSGEIIKYDIGSGTKTNTITIANPQFDRESFRTGVQSDGNMVVKQTGNFVKFNGTSFAVVQTYTGVDSLVTPQGIGFGTLNRSSYDPNTQSIAIQGTNTTGTFQSKAFHLYLGSGPALGNNIAIRFNSCNHATIKGITITRSTAAGIYWGQSDDAEIIDTFFAGQNAGYGYLIDQCRDSLVQGNYVDASTSVAFTPFADFAGKAVIYDDNVAESADTYFFTHTNAGFENNSPLIGYTADLIVTNNAFSSGRNVGGVCVNIVGSGDGGIIVEGNVIENSQGQGMLIGGLTDAVISNNTIRGNQRGLSKVIGAVLKYVSITNNNIYANTDFNVRSQQLLDGPANADGVSTVYMHNPQNDVYVYTSWMLNTPMVEGNAFGVGGFVFPTQGPNSEPYSIRGSAFPLSQFGTTTSIAIAPFTIDFPDKSVNYTGLPTGGALAPTVDHGFNATYYVFVDDPYHDGITGLVYGTTTNVSDLATTPGRLYLGSVTPLTAGNGAVTAGGNIQLGSTNQLPVTQPYVVACTFVGKPLAPQTIIRHPAPNVGAITFPFNWVGSCATVNTPASVSGTQFVLRLNGTEIGRISFGPTSNFGTFTGIGGTLQFRNTQDSDVLTLDVPNPADATLQDIGVSLLGTRQFQASPSQLQLQLSDNMNNWQDLERDNFPAMRLTVSDQLVMTDAIGGTPPGQVDMLTIVRMDPSLRGNTYLDGPNSLYTFDDTVNHITWYIKGKEGYPWDGKFYDSNFAIYIWITENVWSDPHTRKFFRTKVPLVPRFYVPGSGEVSNISTDTLFHIYSDCSTFVDSNLGTNIKTTFSGPYNDVNFGGDIGQRPYYVASYFYNLNVSTGVYHDEEQFYFCGPNGSQLALGWVRWHHIKDGVIVNESYFNLIKSGSTTLVYPCGVP